MAWDRLTIKKKKKKVMNQVNTFFDLWKSTPGRQGSNIIDVIEQLLTLELFFPRMPLFKTYHLSSLSS